VAWVELPEGRYDALVLNRGLGRGYADINARARVLWTHDLPHPGFCLESRYPGMLAGVVYMSRYARALWRTAWPEMPYGRIIPNGVDLDLFRPREKDPDLLVYASAPNRGLKRLPFLLDAGRARVRPSLRLEAYSRLSILHPAEGEDPYEIDYAAVDASSVDLRDPVPQIELADVLGRAALMLLPSEYPEICSNIVLQSLASGTPVVTTGGLGSTPEWVRHRRTGWLTRWAARDYMIYTLELVRGLEWCLSDPRRLARLQRMAAQTPVWTWEQVGEAWRRYLKWCM
jgi:glycosyltransferase involved in cell wall biosynthesis